MLLDGPADLGASVEFEDSAMLVDFVDTRYVFGTVQGVSRGQRYEQTIVLHAIPKSLLIGGNL